MTQRVGECEARFICLWDFPLLACI